MTEAVILNELTHKGNMEERARDKAWTSTSTQWLIEEGEPGEELPVRRKGNQECVVCRKAKGDQTSRGRSHPLTRVSAEG